MTKKTIIFISLIVTFCGNLTASDRKDGRGSFSYKNGHIAFTYFKNNVASIYYKNNIDSVPQQLTFPKKGWDVVFDLSKDLSKILYVNYPKGNYEICNICLYDIKTKKTDTLLINGSIITTVRLSNDRKHVYFINASEIKNYSPIASKAPHGMDVYEITVESKQVRKLTDLKAYSIQAISITPNDSIIAVNIFDAKGLGLLSTRTGEFKKLKINSPRNPVETYFAAVDIRPDSMIYEAPYELYKHNFKTDQSSFILRCPDGHHFGVIQADDSWTNILFGSGPKTYFYNIPTKKLTEIKLEVK